MLEARSLGRIRFQLLGQAGLFAGHSGTAVRVSTQKGFALVAYLAMNAGRPVSRGVLADLLWGDRAEAQARQSLRQAILTLRRDLGAAGSASLNADDQSLSLTVVAEDVDALQFAACAASADPAQRQRCLQIPWAPFLDNFSVGVEAFDEWATAERHRLDVLATRVFSDLAKQCDAAGDGERAILAVERLIAIDPVDEERVRRLLLLEARYRGPDAALARAKELVARLKREVDAEPEAATLAVIDDIKRGIAPTRLGPHPEPRRASAETETSTAVAVAVADVKNDHPVPQPWSWHDASAVRRGLGLFAIVGLVAGGAALSWKMSGAPSTGESNPPAVITSTSDAWQSPPLPSGRDERASEQRKGAIPIVILPFKTYEDTASVRMMADMMTDDLTNVLSRIRYFRVISRQTARAYHALQIADAGRELGVRYVVESSVRTHGDKLRVSVELTDTASRAVVWATHIEREDTNRHVVLDEIVRRLVRELQVGSYPIESARLSDDSGADALAYRGMAALHVAFSKITLEAYDQARVLFAEALNRDPKNVLARLGMGSYHVNVAVQRLVPDVNNHLNKAREIITAVIEERPQISGAHHQLGVILQTTGKLKEAIESFERSLEINPSNAGSHAHIGFALARMGRAAEGIEHIRYALRLSPKDPVLPIWLEMAGAAELELGHYQQAIEYFQRSIAIAPTYPRPWAGLVAAQALAGDLESSRRSADELRKSAPTLTAQQLYERFARLSSESLRLQEGLRRALLETAGSPATQRAWLSPVRPSQTPREPIARERGLVAIAVLPFRSYGENGDSKAVVADMVTDDLTYLLSRVSVFRVISNQTAARYRGQNIDIAAVGAELGVHYLVEGTVSTRENILTATVALVDAGSRLQIWSGRFERTGGDRHAMQREIVSSLARELQVSATKFENGRISNDPDVHELIFKGFAAIQESRLNGVEALRPAEGYFQKALERDPKAIRAQIGLGAFHAHMAVQLFAPDPAPHLVKAEAILQQAINRHPGLSESYQPMGLVHVARGHMDKAAATFERAIELNPSDAPSHAQYGRALVSLGRAQEGLEHIRYAMQLGPRDPVLGYWLAFAGYAYLELGRYDEAIDHLARAHATNPTQPRTALTLVSALAMAGRMNEARLKLEQVQQTHPHLTREKIAKMYGGVDGRLQTREGIQRVLAAETTHHSDHSIPNK
jgi:TolB-like protein/DNA-binding SARP family transcriptional activator/cytochrome c-type biogenesis protein CcmH/NrfG